MRLHRLTLRNIGFDGPHEGERVIDFDALPDGIIRLAGKNGTGKSTLSTFSGPATLFLEDPNQGDMNEFANMGDSFAELEFSSGGSRYVATITMTVRTRAKDGKIERKRSIALTRDGELVADKKRDYLDEIAKVIGAKDDFLAIAYQHQRTGETHGKVVTFTGGDGGKNHSAVREAIFSRFLRLGPYDQRVEICNARIKALKPKQAAAAKAVERVDDTKRTIEESGAELAQAEDVSKNAAMLDEIQKGFHADAAKAVEDIQRRCEQSLGRAHRRKELNGERKAREDAIGRELSARLGVTEAERAFTGGAETLDQARKDVAEIRSAAGATVDDIAAWDARVEALDRAEVDVTSAQVRVDEIQSELAELNDLYGDLADRIAGAEIAEHGAASTLAVAQQRSAEHEGTISEARRGFDACEANRKSTEALWRSTAMRAHELEQVPCESLPEEIYESSGCGDCPLIAGAKKAAAEIEGCEAAVRDATDRINDASNLLSTLLGQREGIAEELSAASQAFGEAAETLAALRKDEPKLGRINYLATDALPQAEAVLAQRVEVRDGAKRVLDAMDRPDGDREILEKLQGYEARVAHYEKKVASLDEALRRARHEHTVWSTKLSTCRSVEAIESDLSTLPPIEAPSDDEINEARAKLREESTKRNAMESAVRNALDDVAKVKGRLEALESQLAQQQAEADAAAEVDTKVGRWEQLKRFIRRIVALRIEASAGGITDTVNALLDEAVEGRFRVAISADWNGSRRQYGIHVTDTTTGSTRELRNFSGGQQTIVRQALMFGLMSWANAQSDKPYQTMWLDEADAAVDREEGGAAYRRLLRAFHKLTSDGVGGLKVFVVSHAEDIDCDHEIDVARDFAARTMAEAA